MTEKGIVIKREFYLDLLDKNISNFKKGSRENIAILGPKKSGKTSILKDHIKNVKDLESISANAVGSYIQNNLPDVSEERKKRSTLGSMSIGFDSRSLRR